MRGIFGRPRNTAVMGTSQLGTQLTDDEIDKITALSR
jgi:hypothetical protein